MKAIGDKLKTMRIQAGLTQKELGDILHVSYQAVSKWETNRGLPDPSLFPDIARALNTSVNRLFYDNEDIPPDKGDGFNEKNVEAIIVDESQKSVYKPVSRKFLFVALAIFVVVVFITSLFIVHFDRQAALKSQLGAAFNVFLQEDNVEVTANYNGALSRFSRKYFFDGRVLLSYVEENTVNYFYDGTLYSVKDGKVETETISYDDYLDGLPKIYSLSLDEKGVKSVANVKNEYKIKLKSVDNLPIAGLFGFSKNADVRVFLENGKINGVVVSEGENKLSLLYKFGYDFQINLPDYINP